MEFKRELKHPTNAKSEDLPRRQLNGFQCFCGQLMIVNVMANS